MIQIRTIITMVGIIFLTLPVNAQLTLDDCQSLAQKNHPLLTKYDLINQSVGFTVQNLSKGYYPQLALSGQVTYQNEVMTLPDALQNMLTQNGYEVQGLKKDQYKIALDLNQTIYDGGNISASKNVSKAEGEVRLRQNEVELFTLRDRVNNLYFGILLLDEKLQLNELLQGLLLDNCRKLEAMQTGGIAMQSDVDALKAEYLSVCQQQAELQSLHNSFCKMLAIFIGREINEPLVKPEPIIPISSEVMRPELRLFDAQTEHIQARIVQVERGLRPKISLFAQGYYGYPGYDMFNDMFEHRWTLNGMVGIRLNWNIGKLYTYKNDKRKLNTAIDEIENAREVFLFNNKLQVTESQSAIDRYERIMSQDQEIINLRSSVRLSAEAKLEHGVIDVNGLLQEITRENQARIDMSVHEIEMLKSIYELRNRLNQ